MTRPTTQRRLRGLIFAAVLLVAGVGVAVGASPVGTTGNSPLAGTVWQTVVIVAGTLIALLGAAIGARWLMRTRR